MSRSIALILCFSLVGATVAPGAYLPCCCKKACEPAIKEQPRQCCKTEPSLDPASRLQGGRLCCGTHSPQHTQSVSSYPSSEYKACCSSKMMKKECPACRCLEQMQIVALSGTPTGQATVRTSAVIPLTAVEFPTTAADPATELISELDCRGAPVNLRTCNLRC